MLNILPEFIVLVNLAHNFVSTGKLNIMIKVIHTHIKKTSAAIALLSAEVIIVLLLFFSSFFLFLVIADTIILQGKDAFDNMIFDYLNRHVSNLNNSVMQFFTFMGTSSFMLPANIVLFTYFAYIKPHRWYSIKIPVISLTSLVVMVTLKQLFNRPRPLIPLLHAAQGLSFPSGHALTSTTFYGLLIYIVWERVKDHKQKWFLVVALLFLILIIGFSRIYLRVHYASDVMAGYCMGLVWLVISLWALRHLERFTHKKIDPVVEEEKPVAQSITI